MIADPFVSLFSFFIFIDRSISVASNSPRGTLTSSVSAPAIYNLSTATGSTTFSPLASCVTTSSLTSSASATTLSSSYSSATLSSSHSAATLASSYSLGSISSVDTIVDESPVIPVIMQFGEEKGVCGLDGSKHAPSGGAKGLGLGVVGGEASGDKREGGEGGGMLNTPMKGDAGSVHSLSPLPISFGSAALVADGASERGMLGSRHGSANANASPPASVVVGSGLARSDPPSAIGSERGSPPSSRHSPTAAGSGFVGGARVVSGGGGFERAGAGYGGGSGGGAEGYDVPHKPIPSTVPLPDVAEERERQMREAMERMGLGGTMQMERERGVYSSVYAHQEEVEQHQRQLEYEQHKQQQQQQHINLAPTHLDIYGPSTTTGGGFGVGISPQRSPGHIHAQVAASGYGGVGMGLHHNASDLALGSGHLSSLHDNGLRTAPLPGTAAAIDVSASSKTPNVYINGLPPHFPEDQLYALAAPYGEIRSVRTFTRHVRDCESGYGFVLFETIDAAEKCIIALRKYRNLHPTFSKQIHKIPGTAYAQGTATNSLVGGLDLSGMHGAAGSDASFKAKMESLADPTSTNLYMEGLPLSIDEPTLAALVSPHRIVSSRFFQTRLSSPPRIIAFVRLDTRHGAEEIIERLHGRMVRGWNDTGSRISVRFADTTEQRELRKRMERSAQEGDSAPSRLTIAQAALLNLRGQDLQPPKPGPVIHTGNIGMGRVASGSLRGGLATSASVPDFSSNLYHQQGMSSGLEVDYSLAPGRAAAVLGSRSHSPYDFDHGASQQHLLYSMGLTPPATSAMPLSVDPTMAALIDSSQHTLGGANAFSSGYGLRRTGAGLSTSQSLDNLQGYAHSGATYARTGYTPAEEYIMRAHAETSILAAQQQQVQIQQAHAQLQHGERRRPAPLNLSRQRSAEEMMGAMGGLEEHDMVPANIGVGVRAYRTQASLNRVASGLGSVTSPLSPSEDEVHSHSSMQQQQAQRPLPISPLIPSTAQDQHANANDLLAYHQQAAAAHMRSTTLPQHRSSGPSGAQRHVQHNSMSMPAQNLRTPQHASVAAFANASGQGSSGTIYESEGPEEGVNARAGKGDTADVAQGSRPLTTAKSGPFGVGDGGMEQNSNSPSMISPTLTYSSQTPSTLSPATPFFGSFGNQEGFEKGVGYVGEQQQKKSPNPHGAVGSTLGPSNLRS
ncbi:hypothetical protein CVT24_010910 [Panaeolus cyanescens]|uniref:RRM domain-containing protein n=1 Tax=Panaeolus cyanescens TaxID=181874 RepID=A0A409WAU6_9AGAR|nr:hypothetical protein CVT24_010910 [Panaeolus cyanescens]